MQCVWCVVWCARAVVCVVWCGGWWLLVIDTRCGRGCGKLSCWVGRDFTCQPYASYRLHTSSVKARSVPPSICVGAITLTNSPSLSIRSGGSRLLVGSEQKGGECWVVGCVM